MNIGISTLLVRPGESGKSFPVISKFFKDIELTFNEKLNYEDGAVFDKIRKNIFENNLNILSIHMPTRRPVAFSNEVLPVDIASKDDWIRKWSIREIEKSVVILRNFLGNSDSKKYLVLHCGKKEDGLNIEKSIKSIMEIKDFAAQFSVEVLIENIPGSFVGNTIDEIIDISKELKLGICFDIGHSFLNGNLYEDLKKSIKMVKSIHLHDTRGIVDEHLVPGDGKIDFGIIKKILSDGEYNGNIIFEIYPYKDIEEILKNLKNFSIT